MYFLNTFKNDFIKKNKSEKNTENNDKFILVYLNYYVSFGNLSIKNLKNIGCF